MGRAGASGPPHCRRRWCDAFHSVRLSGILRLPYFCAANRKKDGKDHRYFNIVENQRDSAEMTVQRTVLYLGEIDDQQQASWREMLAVFDE
jgi:hypothetical protein